MRVRYKLFPYPVLCSETDDYLDNQFYVDFKVAKNINEIQFSMSLIMNDEKLQQMIRDKMIEIVYHFECSKTLFRKLYSTNCMEKIISIEEKYLNGRLDVCCFLIARKSFGEYINNNFNDDYDRRSFNIKKGNILAFYNLPKIEFTKNTDELSSVSSIFSILRREDVEKKGITIELDGDKIKIWLGNEEFYKYRDNARNALFQPMLHAILILPTLIYAFDVLAKDGIEEYEQNRWFKALSKVLETSGITLTAETIDDYGSFELAQKILNFPVNRALQNMNSDSDEDEEL